MKPTVKLTRREYQVWRRVARCQTNAEIAKGLGIAVGTVNYHVENLYRKLRCSNRVKVALAYWESVGVEFIEEPCKGAVN